MGVLGLKNEYVLKGASLFLKDDAFLLHKFKPKLFGPRAADVSPTQINEKSTVLQPSNLVFFQPEVCSLAQNYLFLTSV